MSAPLQTALVKGFNVTSKAAYRPIKQDGKVIGELQLRKDETLVLWIRTTPTDAKLRKAVTATTSNKKWAARLDVTEASLSVARQILEAAAATVPAKKAAAKKKHGPGSNGQHGSLRPAARDRDRRTLTHRTAGDPPGSFWYAV
jgi:hypothetical protein